jgi:signal transduction histidine kinase
LLAGASESTTRMTHLAATFLDVARMQEGRLTIHREPCDIAALLRECGQELGIWAIRDQKQITFAIDDDLPALFVDVGLMRRIILNLLSNAIKHTPLGTPITLGAEIAGDEARLFVRDGGEGIPPELQSQIFDRFSASTRTQEYQSSTGLGLTFCKLAVESHGGMIELCSLLEAGTTFVVRLPLEMNLLPASAH